jgi:hypothetical protein
MKATYPFKGKENPDFDKRREDLFDSIDRSRFITEKEIGSWQILSEAFNVYRNTLETLDYSKSVDSLVDSLEDCLEGYAIFPGSQGRRELFEWWLLDVVPASWFLCPPQSLYPIEPSDNFKEIKSQRLDKLAPVDNLIQVSRNFRDIMPHLKPPSSTQRKSL